MKHLFVAALFVVGLASCEANVFMKSHASLREGAETKDPRTHSDTRVRRKRAFVPNTSKSGFTVQEARDVVNQHNILRTNTTPSAGNMEKMIWHEYLAEMAQDWAAGCSWSHGQPSRSWTPWLNIGQNLYIHSAGYDGVAATDAWWQEYVDYTYNAPSGTYLGLTANCTQGQQCGHYTQVVWATSWAVGCGVQYCQSMTGTSISPAYYVVCNYGPAGNFRNSQLYQSGQACASCPSSRASCTTQNPVAGLCDWSATCNGYTCSNGGTMNTDACICDCTYGWTGQFCNNTAPITTMGGGTTQQGGTTTPSSATTHSSSLTLLVASLLGVASIRK